MQIDHIAMQLPLSRANATIDWYVKFFPQASRLWSLTREQLSEQTRTEMPLLHHIVALQLGAFEIHFLAFQVELECLQAHCQIEHICILVEEPLERFLAKWHELHELFESTHTGCTENPSELDLTNKGFRTIYVRDPNSIRIELRERL